MSLFTEVKKKHITVVSGTLKFSVAKQASWRKTNHVKTMQILLTQPPPPMSKVGKQKKKEEMDRDS